MFAPEHASSFRWTAPREGKFKDVRLWRENSNVRQMQNRN